MKNIVVMGTGLAGMPIIRQTMRNIVLPSSEYKLIVISPTDHFFWHNAMPRAILPNQYSDEQLMFPLATAFKNFPADKFEFVLGTASSVDPDTSTLLIGSRKIDYHTLIIATGSRSKDVTPWRMSGDAGEMKTMLHKAQKEIEQADSIAVIGGGVTGSETAGELGYEYSRVGKKDVHFIYSSDLPLQPVVLEKTRKQTVVELERLKVKLHSKTKLVNTRQAKNGKKTLELQSSDGSTKYLTVSAVIHATGMTPNTSFMPSAMLNDTGNIKQDGYLRASGSRNIFVAGDAGALEPSKASFLDTQVQWLVKHLPAYFSSATGDLPSEPYKKYGVAPRNLEVLTLGKSRGAGHVGTWTLPSLLVWYLKGRHLGTDYAESYSYGKRLLTTTFEK
ncbi:pyridine nucleotide-disulfide oxidoreductase domain-containing protein [Sarocladium implicatum]|nr:pyridine nucleotide-disulfide oxidoreductase domain-containing protein [Sarocladium implicatum]